MSCSGATQLSWLKADGGQPVLFNIYDMNHLEISEVDLEITDGNIICIDVVNVSICVHLDYCKTQNVFCS